MDIEDIKDAWTMKKGGETPADFLAICTKFREYKCVFKAEPFTESDFATCMMLHALAQRGSSKKEKANG